MKVYSLLISVGMIVLGTIVSMDSLATDKQLSTRYNESQIPANESQIPANESQMLANESQRLPMSSPQPGSAFEQLRSKLAQFNQFSAKFRQIVFDAKGQEIQVSEGEMQVQQPNKFRWQTYEPDDSLIVSDGAAVWIYNSFVEQVTAMELNQTVQQSPLWLIANQSDEAWSQFNVSHNQHGYFIVPTDPNSLTKQIIIRFNDHSISQLIIEDSQGQSSEFNLDQFNTRPDFDDKLFIFVMPSGVDFDDQRGAK